MRCVAGGLEGRGWRWAGESMDHYFMRYLFFILLIVLVFGGVAWGQTPALSAEDTNVVAASVSVGEGVPVAVPAPSEKALRHYHTGMVLLGVRTVWELALPSLLLFSGFSARLRDFARRLGRGKWYFSLCIYFLLLALLIYGLSWPLDYYQGFVRPHAYGLSEQTFGKWFGDSLKELAILSVVGVLLLWVPYQLLRRSPRRWWLYAGLGMIPVFFFVQLIRPVVLEPMFNQFTPIENKVLETKILALADRAGIHGSRVYEVKKSVDTKTANAYVTGFMGTKRIVLWDTILSRLNERELLFVMGHEMGHYALGHVVKGILFLSALTLVAFYGIHRAGLAVIGLARGRLGFEQISDIASLPLMLLLMNVFSLVLIPVGFAYSRHLEHEADRFGLEITHYNHSAGTGFVRLLTEDLGVPRPGLLYTLWFGTHPSIGDRIDFFNSYKPWEKGERSKYEGYFKADVGAPGLRGANGGGGAGASAHGVGETDAPQKKGGSSPALTLGAGAVEVGVNEIRNPVENVTSGLDGEGNRGGMKRGGMNEAKQ
ncbi:MAG: Zn-dependent protease with chaperone function [Pedosphaera sp.]|nr:Zn-dependent protease with chaperone function [Pedosphaera sp.]